MEKRSTKQSIADAALQETRRHYRQWRQRKNPGDRIPEDLWQEAVRLCARYPVSRISKLLGLDYAGLKERVSKIHRESERACLPTFIELPPAVTEPAGEYALEIIDGRGKRLHLAARGRPAVEDMIGAFLRL